MLDRISKIFPRLSQVPVLMLLAFVGWYVLWLHEDDSKSWLKGKLKPFEDAALNATIDEIISAVFFFFVLGLWIVLASAFARGWYLNKSETKSNHKPIITTSDRFEKLERALKITGDMQNWLDRIIPETWNIESIDDSETFDAEEFSRLCNVYGIDLRKHAKSYLSKFFSLSSTICSCRSRYLSSGYAASKDFDGAKELAKIMRHYKEFQKSKENMQSEIEEQLKGLSTPSNEQV